MADDFDKVVRAATQGLADEGVLLKAGWEVFRKKFLPNANEDQLNDMKISFYAGAEFVFYSMIQMNDPGDEEPTEADMERIDKLDAELQPFREFLRKLLEERNKNVRSN